MPSAVVEPPEAAPTIPAVQCSRRREPPTRARALIRAVGGHLLVVAAFALPAVVLWWHAWDGHLSSTLTCGCGDPGQTVWFVEWPAYALAHGLSPFLSGAVQAPYGVNLLANASSVLVGVVLAPVTLTAGPVAATNVALTLCPALSAWGCWFACRRLVASRAAAVAAGALFGYSPFVVTNLALGHIGLSLLVAPPLLLLAVHHVLFGPAAARVRWGAGLGALLALQLFISAEVLAIVVVVGVPSSVLAAMLGRRALGPAREVVTALGASLLVAAALCAAPVWFLLAGPQHLSGALWRVQGNALSGLWGPGRYRASADALVRLGGYGGLEGPPSSYLGPVVLAAGGVALVVARRARGAWILATGAALSALCSLGTGLWVTQWNPTNLSLPWRLVASWPILDDVIPQRFSAVTDLCVALLVGVGIDATWRAARARRRAGAWRTGAVSVAVLVSMAAVCSWWVTYQVPFATQRIVLPQWYRDAGSSQVPAGAVVLSYPFPFPLDGSSGAMVWQAVDGMRFRLAGGYVKAPGRGGRPLSHRPVPEVDAVLAGLTAAAGGPLARLGAAEIDAVRAALVRWRVDDVVVLARGRDPARAVQLFRRAIGRAPTRQLGAWVWRLHPAVPGGP